MDSNTKPKDFTLSKAPTREGLVDSLGTLFGYIVSGDTVMKNDHCGYRANQVAQLWIHMVYQQERQADALERIAAAMDRNKIQR